MHYRSSIVKPSFLTAQACDRLRRIKPYSPQRLRFERLIPRKSMTIAAGIRCIDGIVLCADTEYTEGDRQKYQRTKIFGYDDSLLVTGSGWTDYMKMAFDKLYEKLLEKKAGNQREARQIVEEVILDIYSKNIASVFRLGEFNCPSFDLLIAVRCQDGDVVLLKNTETSVTISHAYESVGTGSILYNYWARYFFKFQKSMEIAGIFSLFMLEEAKSAVPGCGGGTEIACMASDLSVPREYTAYLPGGAPLTGFPQNAVDVFLDAVNLRDIGMSVAMFQNSAADLKGLIKSHFEMRARAKAGLEEMRQQQANADPKPPSKRKRKN
jgi:hypothetical protein